MHNSIIRNQDQEKGIEQNNITHHISKYVCANSTEKHKKILIAEQEQQDKEAPKSEFLKVETQQMVFLSPFPGKVGLKSYQIKTISQIYK